MPLGVNVPRSMIQHSVSAENIHLNSQFEVGPVVQNFVSLMSSLRPQLVK